MGPSLWSTCMTILRVVALDQSLLSSRHRMMCSFCSILARTMASTCWEKPCSVAFFFPGAAEMRPVEKYEGNAFGGEIGTN